MPVLSIKPPHFCDPRIGTNCIAGRWSMIDIWYGIHQNAEIWLKSDEVKRKKCDTTDYGIYGSLTSVHATDWSSLSSLAGMTVYGAVALSWCEGAKLDQVWQGWLDSGFPLKPLPEFERPARFLNPALVPQVRTLSAIVTAFAGKFANNPDLYPLALSASIAAQKQSLEFDMEPENLIKAPPQIAAFLKSRLLQKPDLSPQDQTLITAWDTLIKGTEWDIWSKQETA